MEGDVLFINQEVKDVTNRVMEMILEKRYGNEVTNKNDLLKFAAEKILHDNQTIIIAISGESGTGKSVISHELSALFRSQGVFAKCLCADNFYLIPPEEKEAWRKAHKDQIGINEYDWDMINRITDDFRKRRFSTFQVIDLNTQQVESLTTNFAKVNIIIIEGLFTIAEQLKDCDIRIFLTAPEERKKTAQFTRGKEDPNRPFRDFIVAKEVQDVKNLLLGIQTEEVLFLDAISKKNEVNLSWKKAKEIFDII